MKDSDYAGELEDLDDLDGPVDDEWAAEARRISEAHQDEVQTKEWVEKKMLRHEGDKYCAYNEKGTRSFGCYDTEEEAKKRLQQMEMFKRMKKERKQKRILLVMKRGNMPGLAKHLAHQLGGDPNFFDKCMGHESVASYGEDVRKAVCAKAHKLALGIWPGEHGGKNPNGPG